jgi:hypothetical protein
MKKNIRQKITIALVFGLNLAVPFTAYADTIPDGFGQTSFPVMMVDDVNARALALGESTTALNGDIGGVYQNPSSLADIKRLTVSASTMTWLFDGSFQSVAVAMPIPGNDGRYGVAAVSGRMLSTAGLEMVQSGNILGTNGTGDFAVGLNWADNMFALIRPDLAKDIHLNVGIALRYAQTVLLDYSAAALSADFGATYSMYVPNATSLWNVIKDVVTNVFAKKFVLETNTVTNFTISSNLRAGRMVKVATTNPKADFQMTTNWLTNDAATNLCFISNGLALKTSNRVLIVKDSQFTYLITTNWIVKEIATNLKPVREDTLSVAFAFRNLSGTLWTFHQGDPLSMPWTFDFGALYTVYHDARHNLFTTLQISQPSDSGVMLTVGAEYSYKNTIFLRGGYKIVGREEEEGPTFGVGLNFEVMDHLALQADYAHVFLASLGSSDIFTVSAFF